MKKIVSLVLTAAMVLSTGKISAFAATQTELTSVNGDVNAQYVPGDHTATYSLDITWGAMQFDYNVNEAWNTQSHKWEPNDPAWSVKNDSNTVTVKNNSSVAVDAVFSFANKDEYNTVSGSFACTSQEFTANKLSMEIAAEDTAATEHIVTFMPSGSIPSSVENYTNVGTITITLSEPQE
ncbi:MAG: hypothetical protein Q4F95_01975 [Oscillospiraceae bacterium]|nr:hypothetical protein [Oscillospiraceae bacterium]